MGSKIEPKSIQKGIEKTMQKRRAARWPKKRYKTLRGLAAPGVQALGRSPPKGLANPSPPAEKSPHPHFSTPFPCNPFPSSSFPFPSLRFPCLPLSWPVLACLGSIFPPNLAPTWLPKSTEIQTKWSLDGVPILTSFLHRFLFDFYSELGPPKPQKSLKFHCFFQYFC